MRTISLTAGCDTRICPGILVDSGVRREKFQVGWVDIHAQYWDGCNHETHNGAASIMFHTSIVVIQGDLHIPS